jgi:hypothetical protein
MANHAASAGGFVSAGAGGKVKWNVAPRPPLPLAQIRPPCDSTIGLLIATPMPLPYGCLIRQSKAVDRISSGDCHELPPVDRVTYG